MVTHLERRRVSNLHIYWGFGSGIPTAIMGGLLVWVGTQDYPALVGLGAALVALGLRIVFGTAAGGVRVDPTTIDIRGWLRRQRVDRCTVRAVGQSARWYGSGRGWLDTSGGRVYLSGLTVHHNHISPDQCPACVDARSALERLARDLEVPFVVLEERGPVARYEGGA